MVPKPVSDDPYQRITISVPSSLYNRLQEVKDSLNVSQICQKAITYAVEYEEIKKMEGSEMDKITERLKKEKEESEKEDRENGKKAGFNDAKQMSYKDLKFVMRELETREEMANSQASYDELSNNIFDRFDKEDGYWMDMDDADPDVYLEGWLEGVADFVSQNPDLF